MGNPETLKKFVSFTTQYFPSRKTALILSSHGSGWLIENDEQLSAQTFASASTAYKERSVQPSIVVDNTNNNSVLNISEIKTALNGYHLDILGFDACYMANIEVAYDLRELCDYMIFSQTEEPKAGWNYTGLLDDFSLHELSATQFITSAIDSYAAFYNSIPATPAYTLSAVNTKRIKDFTEYTLPQLSAYIMQPGNRDIVVQAMRNAFYFYSSLDGISYFLDLQSFIGNLATLTIETETSAVWLQLLEKLTELTVYQKNCSSLSAVGSINIFLPYSPNYFLNNDPIDASSSLAAVLAVYSQTEFAGQGWQDVVKYLY
jgi:hypothetical protein